MSDSSVTPWAAAHQDLLSMEFSKPEYLSGLPFPSLGDLPDPGIQLTSPALAGGFFTTEPPCFITVLKLYKITDTCNFLSQ